jgi:spermidine synthase
MAVASLTLDPVAVDVGTLQGRLDERVLKDLQYYNAQVHSALFALPTFYAALAKDG